MSDESALARLLIRLDTTPHAMARVEDIGNEVLSEVLGNHWVYFDPLCYFLAPEGHRRPSGCCGTLEAVAFND